MPGGCNRSATERYACSGVPLMDVHDTVEGLTAEAVASAHQRTLEV